MHDVRSFNQSELHAADNTLLVLPKLAPDRYHAFISHSQQDGGDQVAHVKKELEKYVGSINIFTDVGRVERALTEKSQLYTAIGRSEVFLVFLSKTFFTRKWCVKEFQEAIATGKHIVLVVDTDPRHGGFSGRNLLEQFGVYSAGQQVRAGRTQRRRRQPVEPGEAGWRWRVRDALPVGCDHVRVRSRARWPCHRPGGDDYLAIDAFVYHPLQGDAGPVDASTFPVIRWYRFAEEKKVALQQITQRMLEVP